VFRKGSYPEVIYPASGPYQVRIYNYGEDTEKALPYTKTLQVSVSAGIKIVSLPDKSSRSVCRLRFGVWGKSGQHRASYFL